jgi:NDP-4-keto-2,6-dideoxyhexose 3-C-methyltransferase
VRDTLGSFLREEKKKGKSVFVYGASTKGNIMLTWCGIDGSIVTAAADRNPEKWGRRTPGTNIPIISEEEARARNPDYFLVLPWHFLSEFIEREADFLASGGRFVVPLPEFNVIGEE